MYVSNVLQVTTDFAPKFQVITIIYFNKCPDSTVKWLIAKGTPFLKFYCASLTEVYAFSNYSPKSSHVGNAVQKTPESNELFWCDLNHHMLPTIRGRRGNPKQLGPPTETASTRCSIITGGASLSVFRPRLVQGNQLRLRLPGSMS